MRLVDYLATEFKKESGIDLIDEEPRVGAGGTRMAFVHPRDAHGVLTELVELPKDRER